MRDSKELLVAALLCLTTPAFAVPPTKAPLSPREAAAAMTVPDGFKVTLFAGEPDVSQPIAMCFDDRGRLWVAECHSYPKWIKPAKDAKPGDLIRGEDKILIFEDTDNDGQFDKRTVFMDKLANLSSIEFGFGGIYALTAPYLIHIPMDLKTDRPTGTPKILLDGWAVEKIQHNMVNSLKWGPDGWLYGCHGILDTSWVGSLDTPKDKRTPINCGVWRFHPVTKRFEVVCHGGTNPWGIDWDEQGELYFTNCVIDHAFHVIPGGHYQRMYGTDFNPHLYKLMGSAVDHLHWAGGHWTSSRGAEGKHSEAGGGHAHSGCMIYLGDNFPKEYRNCLFTGNIHGNRLNRDRIDYTNKGPVLKHEKDFLFGNDPWFRPIAMDYGPDGGVYVIDWTDTGECHNYDKVHKSGRIYKVWYGPTGKLTGIPSFATDDLVAMQAATNEWMVRHSRRLLHERHLSELANGIPNRSVRDQVVNRLGNTRNLEGLGLKRCVHEDSQIANSILMIDRTLHENDLFLLGDEMSGIHMPRPAAIHLIMNNHDPRFDSKLKKIAKSSRNWRVSAALASGLEKLQPNDRWSLANILAERKDFRDDPHITLLLWYSIEALVEYDVPKSLQLLSASELPLLREFISRRIASFSDANAAKLGIDSLVRIAFLDADKEIARDILAGIQAALQGRRSAPEPKDWEDASLIFRRSPIREVRDRGMALGVIFGDKLALESLVKLTKDPKAVLPRRQDALKTLVFKQPDDLPALLGELLGDDALRGQAIRALAIYKHEAIASKLVSLYPKLTPGERGDAIGTLSSRPTFALALLDAVADKKIPRTDLGPVEVRQLHALKNAKVSARVEEVWGSIRQASADKKTQMAKFKNLLSPESLKAADHVQGRLLFTKHCASCHKLFGEGAAIAPDITGAQRGSLDYLLENILDPNAIVPKDYQVTVFTTNNGRVLTGIVKEETDRAVSVQTATELVVVPKTEIESRTPSKQSMMPEGILEPLPEAEMRALIAYLQRQEPLPK